VVRGRGLAIIVQTGSKTELGKIQANLQEKDDDSRTPLQDKLDEFAERLTWAIGFVCLFVWVINIRHFTDPEHGGVLKVFCVCRVLCVCVCVLCVCLCVCVV